MKPFLPLLLAVSATLAACAAPAGMSAYRLVDVTGPVVVPGAVAGPSFSLKTMEEVVRVPFELGRLAYIEVWSRKGNQEFTKLGQLAPHGDGDADRTFDPVKLVNLEPRQDYDVRLMAYQLLPGDDMPVPVNSEDLSKSTTHFSTASQHPDVTGGANEQVTLYGGFALQLADQNFEGKARGEIDAKNGVLEGNGQPMALDMPSVVSLSTTVLNYWTPPNIWYTLYYNPITRLVEIKTGIPLQTVASGTVSTTSATTALSAGSLKVDNEYQATWTLNGTSRTFYWD